MNKLVSLKAIGALLLSLSLAGCIVDAERDEELEARLAQIVDAEEIVAMSTFGQLIVTVSSDAPFDMPSSERERLATAMAYTALETNTESEVVLVAIASVDAGDQELAYVFENKGGTLELIEAE